MNTDDVLHLLPLADDVLASRRTLRRLLNGDVLSLCDNGGDGDDHGEPVVLPLPMMEQSNGWSAPASRAGPSPQETPPRPCEAHCMALQRRLARNENELDDLRLTNAELRGWLERTTTECCRLSEELQRTRSERDALHVKERAFAREARHRTSHWPALLSLLQPTIKQLHRAESDLHGTLRLLTAGVPAQQSAQSCATAEGNEVGANSGSPPGPEMVCRQVKQLSGQVMATAAAVRTAVGSYTCHGSIKASDTQSWRSAGNGEVHTRVERLKRLVSEMHVAAGTSSCADREDLEWLESTLATVSSESSHHPHHRRRHASPSSSSPTVQVTLELEALKSVNHALRDDNARLRALLQCQPFGYAAHASLTPSSNLLVSKGSPRQARSAERISQRSGTSSVSPAQASMIAPAAAALLSGDEVDTSTAASHRLNRQLYTSLESAREAPHQRRISHSRSGRKAHLAGSPADSAVFGVCSETPRNAVEETSFRAWKEQILSRWGV